MLLLIIIKCLINVVYHVYIFLCYKLNLLVTYVWVNFVTILRVKGEIKGHFYFCRGRHRTVFIFIF